MPTDCLSHPLAQALRPTRGAWLWIGAASVLINLLTLTGTFYMMAIYERVISSHSFATLGMISLAALLGYGLHAWLEHLRGRMLVRLGAAVDCELAPHAVRAAVLASGQGCPPAEALQTSADVAAIRQFLSGPAPAALFDLPFTPVLVLVGFFVHPWLGLFSLAAVLVVVTLTAITEARGRHRANDLATCAARQAALLETGQRNGDLIRVAPMREGYLRQMQEAHASHVLASLEVTEPAISAEAWARTLRHTVQSGVLGLGAWLVIRGELSPGAILAVSILAVRAVQPVEAVLAQTRVVLAARAAWVRLRVILPQLVEAPPTLSLPPPRQSLMLEDVAIVAPGRRQTLVSRASLRLSAGQVCALVGASGSGKSSLLRAIAGVHPVVRGVIRLDGALLQQWPRDARGQAIGYMAQDCALMPGTIADNIARFDPRATRAQVMAAAQAAGVHEMIISLSDGYDHRIETAALSGGQQQWIALARALFGEPFLVLLDEPDAHLDDAGEAALARAVAAVAARGGIVLMITHRARALAATDLVAVMERGQIIDFGVRERIRALHPGLLPASASAIAGSGEQTGRQAGPADDGPDADMDDGETAERQIAEARDLRQMATRMRAMALAAPGPAQMSPPHSVRNREMAS